MLRGAVGFGHSIRTDPTFDDKPGDRDLSLFGTKQAFEIASAVFLL